MKKGLLELLKIKEKNESIFREINEIKLKNPLTILDKKEIQHLQQKIK